MLQSEERLEVDPEAAGKVTVRFHEKLEDDEVITAISAAVIQRKTSSGPPPVYATATGIEVSASEIVNAIDDDGVTELGTSQAVQLTISDSDADVSTPERGRDYRIVTTVTISGRSTPLVSKNPLTLRA